MLLLFSCPVAHMPCILSVIDTGVVEINEITVATPSLWAMAWVVRVQWHQEGLSDMLRRSPYAWFCCL